MELFEIFVNDKNQYKVDEKWCILIWTYALQTCYVDALKEQIPELTLLVSFIRSDKELKSEFHSLNRSKCQIVGTVEELKMARISSGVKTGDSTISFI